MLADHTPESFDRFIRDLAQLNGLDEATAGDYAITIGDAPETDSEGRALIRDESGTIITRLILPED